MLISYKDNRGEVYPSFRKSDYSMDFVEDRFSISKKNVIRGFHGDNKTWKLCHCVYGELKLVLWDLKKRIKSEFILSENNKSQVLIPPNFLNAHLCISEKCILFYKWSEYYDIDCQWSIKYNDPDINEDWGVVPILSDRDKKACSLKEFYELFDNEI